MPVGPELIPLSAYISPLEVNDLREGDSVRHERSRWHQWLVLLVLGARGLDTARQIQRFDARSIESTTDFGCSRAVAVVPIRPGDPRNRIQWPQSSGFAGMNPHAKLLRKLLIK